jgi:hypothetical protein
MARETRETPKTERPGVVRLAFQDEKSPNAKPALSEDEALRLVTAIEEGKWCEGVFVEEEACTYGACGAKVDGFKQLVAQFGYSINCRYSCEWFYSKGGGWEHVCYANCTGGGLSIEAVL